MTTKKFGQFAFVLFIAFLTGCSVDDSSQQSSIPVNAEPAIVRVVTSGGLSAAYDSVAAEIESTFNVTLVTERGSSTGVSETSIPSRLQRGEVFDVILLSQESLNELTEAGYVVADSRTDIALSPIGMAVRQGTEVPDISTVEKFREVLLAADSIAYSASVSGTYLANTLWPQMGIWDAIKDKSRLIVTERVGTVMERDNIAVGFQQLSELLPFEGIQVVGPIPDEVQLVSVFSGGVPVSASNPEDAAKVLQYLASPNMQQALRASGLGAVDPGSSD